MSLSSAGSIPVLKGKGIALDIASMGVPAAVADSREGDVVAIAGGVDWEGDTLEALPAAGEVPPCCCAVSPGLWCWEAAGPPAVASVICCSNYQARRSNAVSTDNTREPRESERRREKRQRQRRVETGPTNQIKTSTQHRYNCRVPQVAMFL